MSIEFREADQSVHDLLGAVMDEYFPELSGMDPSLVVDIRMAVDGADMGKRLLHRGHLVGAMIKVVGAEERAAGGADVRLKIDQVSWDKRTERQRVALLHHELTHVEPKRDTDTGLLVLDPYGRPKIKLRLDDWMLTGFLETARIFGLDSVERVSIEVVAAKLSQLELPFVDDAAGPAPSKRRRKAASQEARDDV